MPLCIVVALGSLGTAFLSFIAGLQGIDRSQFEAGAVDGIRSGGGSFGTCPAAVYGSCSVQLCR